MPRMPRLYTCVDALRHIEKSYHNPQALNWRDEEGSWHVMSTEEFVRNVKMVALGLHELGVRRGACIGLMAMPSAYWTIVDFAIMALGAVTVPLFANISDENFVYEATQTGLKIIFIEGSEPWNIFRKHEELFDIAIALDSPGHAKAKSIKELISLGEQLNSSNPNLYEEIRNQVRPSDLGTIIYTSGSTGMPKGVELTHENMATVLDFPLFHWDPAKDRYLSILPLAHVLGHCVNLWLLTAGVSVYYSNDYKNLAAVCHHVKPTAMVVVPRLLEKVYMKIADKIHTAEGIKGSIGRWGFAMARKPRLGVLDHILYPLANLLVFSKMRQSLGGHLRIVISGGAHLNPHLHEFFENIGIRIYEGWGLTEACPVCVNTPKKHRIGSVGLPVDRQQLSVTPEGEILVKGTLVMRGYHKNPEATARVIDEDGWLHTGDRGTIDSKGMLTILGRMKELYKTSTGEYVAPVPIEQSLGRHPLVDMCMVVADGHKFATCLIFPNMETVARMKKEQKLAGLSDQEFLDSHYVHREVEKLIGSVNEHVNHWEQIRDFRIINEPLTIQSGELTPSMKIRREVVIKKYKALIDAMYAHYHEEVQL